MPIKAVLFDVIGTTVVEADSNTIVNCFEKAFRDHGLTIDPELVRANRGRDKREMIELIAIQQKLSAGFSVEIYKSFLQNVEANLYQFKPRDEAEDLFHHLRKQKIRIGLGTGLSRDLLEKILKHIQWSIDQFDYVGIPEGTIRSRPYADMILDLMNKLNLNANNILKVGDTVADIQEGKNAGVKTVAILAGTQSKSMLKAEKPDFIIRNLSEIKKLIN